MLLEKSKQLKGSFFPTIINISLFPVTSPIYVTVSCNMNYTSIPYNIILFVMMFPLALQAKHK